MLHILLLQSLLADTKAADTKAEEKVATEATAKTSKPVDAKDKKAPTEEKPCSILDLDQATILGSFFNQSTKKVENVTRGSVVAHLKAIGFDVSAAQPISQTKEIEMQAAAFLVVMNYVLPLAKEAGIEKELEERIKFMAAQLIYARFMEKRVMDQIDMNTIRQEAMAEVKKKRQGEYCYDVFVTVTKTAEQAKEVIAKVQKLQGTQSNSLIKDLETVAEEAQKSVEEKDLKHPALIAAKRTNGWLLPREMLTQESEMGGADLVFLIKELILQFLGKDIGEQIVGKGGKGGLKAGKLFAEPFKFEGHYLVVYVVNAKPFDKLGKLVEMFASEDMRQLMGKKRKEVQFSVIQDIYKKNKDHMKLVGPDGKNIEIPEKVLKMLGYSM